MRKILKQITPPFIYSLAKQIFSRPLAFHPQWNTLNYRPLQGVKVFFDPTGSWQKKIISNTYDTFLFDRLKSYNLVGKVFYDIGAHIGFHSLYFAKLVGTSGKVYAFEPNPDNVERLKMNIEANPDLKSIISIFRVAVSDTVGQEVEFTMSDEVESGRSSGGFIEPAHAIWGKETFQQRGFREVKVQTVTVDSIREMGIKELPDFLKIDVEGAEHLVLLGAKQTLLTKKPLIFMEIHSMIAMQKVTTLLLSIGYNLEIINQENDGRCFVEAKPQK